MVLFYKSRWSRKDREICFENAVIYDYFYDKWIPFEEIVNNIPYEFGDAESFLKTHHKLEFNKTDIGIY